MKSVRRLILCRFASRVKIYTKTGDKGSSSLFSTERRLKNDMVFDALGDSDELNANIGLAREYIAMIPTQGGNDGTSIHATTGLTLEELNSFLGNIQSRILDLGSHIATPNSSSSQERLARATFGENHVVELEKWIDRMDFHLPPLTNFILPGGGLGGSQLHISRAVCRRTERKLVSLMSQIDTSAYQYMNRLSDFLFVAARFVSMKEQKQEIIYKKARE